MNPKGESKKCEKESARYGPARKEGERERETDQDQVVLLARGQESVVVPVGRHLLQDDGCSPGELDEAPLVVAVLRILFAGLPCEFCGAQPVFEVFVGIPQFLARLVSKLSNGGRASRPF